MYIFGIQKIIYPLRSEKIIFEFIVREVLKSAKNLEMLHKMPNLCYSYTWTLSLNL